MARVRSVNGYGPRCGCGGMSVIHVQESWHRPVSPENSRFLCLACALVAVDMFFGRRRDQPHYWPGDEDRDESYVRPASPAFARNQPTTTKE